MFAACCCSDSNQETADIVEPLAGGSGEHQVPGAPLLSVDEEDEAPPFKAVEEESFARDLSPGVCATRAPAALEQPAQEFLEFDVTVDKSGGEKLGLDISAYDGKTLLVGRVKPGPVERWNTQYAGQWDMCVLRGDKVLVINGVRGDSDELLAAARADVLNLTICRRVEFAVNILCKGRDDFGLDFEDALDGRVLISRTENGTLATETNQLNPPDMEMRPGDQVVQLNGEVWEGADAVRAAMATQGSSQAAGILAFRFRRGRPNT